MFGLGGKKASTVYGVVYDIGSESVGVAIVESDKHTQYPTVLFNHRVQMRIGKSPQDEAERVRAMREALFSASLIVSRDGLQALIDHNKHARVEEFLVTVSAPWSYTIARNVRYEGEKDLKVTRTLIDELVASAESEIEKHIEDAFETTTLSYQVVERATVDVRINDYAVTEPLGLHGKEISLVHVTGVIPTDILGAMNEVQEKIFPNTILRSHTFLLVLYCILRELFPERTSLTLVHVTGESTEFGIVENGTLVESISIPHGLNSILRSHGAKNGQTLAEIYTELTLYHEKGLTAEREKEIAAFLKEYGEGVAEGLRAHAEARRFPRQAFILAPHTFTELFKETLAPILKTELGIMDEPLILKEDIINAGTPVGDDINISVTSRFFHKLQGCGELESE